MVTVPAIGCGLPGGGPPSAINVPPSVAVDGAVVGVGGRGRELEQAAQARSSASAIDDLRIPNRVHRRACWFPRGGLDDGHFTPCLLAVKGHGTQR